MSEPETHDRALPIAGERDLPDHLRPGLRALFVGINPSIRSAETGHHYAGANNRFWELVSNSGLVPGRLAYHEDSSLLLHGLGLTNIVSRATRSSSDLGRDDFRKGAEELVEKLRRYRPGMLVLVGITVYRHLLPRVGESESAPVLCGLQPHRLVGIPMYVLPNPSGRNAHYPLSEMQSYWEGLARCLEPAKPAR